MLKRLGYTPYIVLKTIQHIGPWSSTKLTVKDLDPGRYLRSHSSMSWGYHQVGSDDSETLFPFCWSYNASLPTGVTQENYLMNIGI